MSVIERYVTEAPEPRTCQCADLSRKDEKCKAELILHDSGKEIFLCKRHAALNLSANLNLLATAVVELATA
jgi:hypothetical protein